MATTNTTIQVNASAPAAAERPVQTYFRHYWTALNNADRFKATIAEYESQSALTPTLDARLDQIGLFSLAIINLLPDLVRKQLGSGEINPWFGREITLKGAESIAVERNLNRFWNKFEAVIEAAKNWQKNTNNSALAGKYEQAVKEAVEQFTTDLPVNSTTLPLILAKMDLIAEKVPTDLGSIFAMTKKTANLKDMVLKGIQHPDNKEEKYPGLLEQIFVFVVLKTAASVAATKKPEEIELAIDLALEPIMHAGRKHDLRGSLNSLDFGKAYPEVPRYNNQQAGRELVDQTVTSDPKSIQETRVRFTELAQAIGVPKDSEFVPQGYCQFRQQECQQAESLQQVSGIIAKRRAQMPKMLQEIAHVEREQKEAKMAEKIAAVNAPINERQTTIDAAKQRLADALTKRQEIGRQLADAARIHSALLLDRIAQRESGINRREQIRASLLEAQRKAQVASNPKLDKAFFLESVDKALPEEDVSVDQAVNTVQNILQPTAQLGSQATAKVARLQTDIKAEEAELTQALADFDRETEALKTQYAAEFNRLNTELDSFVAYRLENDTIESYQKRIEDLEPRLASYRKEKSEYESQEATFTGQLQSLRSTVQQLEGELERLGAIQSQLKRSGLTQKEMENFVKSASNPAPTAPATVAPVAEPDEESDTEAAPLIDAANTLLTAIEGSTNK